MKKVSIEQYIELFSQARIDSYSSIDEHEANFEMLGRIAPKLARIEIIIRNRIDRKMCEQNQCWMLDLPDSIKLDDDDGKIKDHDILVSRQTFGFWIKVVECYKIHSCAFNKIFLKNLSFKKYYKKNIDRVGKNISTNYQKADVLLLILRAIRNRAFHFENLLKRDMNNKPRLGAKATFPSGFIFVTIEPNKINTLLDDVLCSFDEELVR